MSASDIPQPAMVGDKPDTEDFKGEFAITKKNGVELTIRFSFEYPEGEGMALWTVLRRMADGGMDQAIFEHLQDTGDASLLARAAQINTVIRDEDDDPYDDEEED